MKYLKNKIGLYLISLGVRILSKELRNREFINSCMETDHIKGITDYKTCNNKQIE